MDQKDLKDVVSYGKKEIFFNCVFHQGNDSTLTRKQAMFLFQIDKMNIMKWSQ